MGLDKGGWDGERRRVVLESPEVGEREAASIAKAGWSGDEAEAGQETRVQGAILSGEDETSQVTAMINSIPSSTSKLRYRAAYS